jgi:RimJ/RimL family protein N-acetyltransferase
MITEANFIDFKCPYCGDPVSFPEENLGSVQACPNCTESLIVPVAGLELGRKLPLPLTTARLRLRRLASSDWKDLLELLSDEELFQFTNGGPLDEDQILHWLERDAQVKLTTPDQIFHLGIELQAGPKLIGYLGLSFTNPRQLQARLDTLYLSRPHQRQGLASEALDALLGFCFNDIHCQRVSAWADTRNAAACRLFEQAGLRREGEFVKDRFVQGEWVSTAWFAALAEDRRPT